MSAQTKGSSVPACCGVSNRAWRVQMALGFDDARVRVEITDGIKWVEEAAEGTYDAIIVDSSDPVGPAEVLFRKVRASHQSYFPKIKALHTMQTPSSPA